MIPDNLGGPPAVSGKTPKGSWGLTPAASLLPLTLAWPALASHKPIPRGRSRKLCLLLVVCPDGMNPDCHTHLDMSPPWSGEANSDRPRPGGPGHTPTSSITCETGTIRPPSKARREDWVGRCVYLSRHKDQSQSSHSMSFCPIFLVSILPLRLACFTICIYTVSKPSRFKSPTSMNDEVPLPWQGAIGA